MMTFITDRFNRKYYLLRTFFLSLGIIAFILIYNFFFPLRPIIEPSRYWIPGALIFISITLELFRKRLYEVSFDIDRKVIVFLFKSPVFKIQHETISFENARFVIMRDGSVFRFVKESYTFCFMNNKFTFLELSNYKDGFSDTKLREISKTFEKLGLPVENEWV